MNPILQMIRAALLGDPQLRAVVSQAFAKSLALALTDVTPTVLGEFLIEVGDALKNPTP